MVHCGPPAGPEPVVENSRCFLGGRHSTASNYPADGVGAAGLSPDPGVSRRKVTSSALSSRVLNPIAVTSGSNSRREPAAPRGPGDENNCVSTQMSADRKPIFLSWFLNIINKDLGRLSVCCSQHSESLNRNRVFCQGAFLFEAFTGAPFHRAGRGEGSNGRIICTKCWDLFSASFPLKIRATGERSAAPRGASSSSMQPTSGVLNVQLQLRVSITLHYI